MTEENEAVEKEIIARTAAWAGSPELARAWYKTQPIPALGDTTAHALVAEGRGQQVLAYLDQVAQGGYA